MRVIKGNIWDFHPQNFIGITTNGVVNSAGELVMGRGVARQASKRIQGLSRSLGSLVKQRGNNVFIDYDLKFFTFPTKHHWRNKADLFLIERSCRQLTEYLMTDIMYLVMPGCGNGGLKWEDVEPVLDKYLKDRVIIVEKEIK